MFYRIAYDEPGRLRIRAGKWVFNDIQARGVACELLQIDDVSSVVVRVANGSVLVEYSKIRPQQTRQKILDYISSLDSECLPENPEDVTCDLAAINNAFIFSLLRTVAIRYFKKIFLPHKLRLVWTVFNSLSYIKEGLRAFKKRKLTVEMLDATAITTALISGHVETAGQVMFLLGISDILADYTHARTRNALRKNLSICVEKVWLVQDNEQEIEVPIENIQIGDKIRVRAGSVVPIDGFVVSGLAELNEATMTGESELVPKTLGNSVHAGTVVEEGSIVVQTTSKVGQSRIDSIVDLVDNSQSTKSLAQSKAEKLADSVVPLSLGLFLADLLLTRSVQRALSVLMVDYSCAIKLSTPIAVMSAMREATNHNIVAKGGKFLEAFAAADTIVFDKTGTLTNAKPEVHSVVSLGDYSEDDILRIAACLEEHYPHSMARAICRAADERNLQHKEELHNHVEYIVAHGIVSAVNGRRVVLGSAHFVFEDELVEKPQNLDSKIAEKNDAGSVVYMAIDGVLEGAIIVEDPIREEAFEVVRTLRDLGFARIVMLTGDSENCAKKVASELNLDDYYSQVLPEDKSSYVQRMKEEGHVVAFVGDGINDSPALACADVSIALSDASEIARSVADVSVLDTSLKPLIELRKLTVALTNRVKSSYNFIIRFNTMLILLGLSGILSPEKAATLHNLSTIALSAKNTTPLLKPHNNKL